MSLKKDASGRRSVQVEVEVPGTPEQVWEAIATGPGISSWFVPCQMEVGKDGKPTTMMLSFGPGMDCPATITEWQPPQRFAAESEIAGPGTPKSATEWIVEARSGGKCVVRVVHNLFTDTDDWDGQLEGTEAGWPGFFRVLTIYLTHFRGQPSAIMQVMASAAGTVVEAWDKFTAALGMTGGKVGAKCSGAAGVPAIGGVVEHIETGTHPGMLLRLDQPTSGVGMLGAFACGGPAPMVMVGFYLYGKDAQATVEREQPLWQKWMSERFQ